MRSDLLVVGVVSVCASVVLGAPAWYSGDPYAAQTAWPQYTDNLSNIGLTRAMTFDNVAWGGGNIASVGGHFHNFNSGSMAGVNTAYWEIRTGLSHNNAGALVLSGSGSVSSSLTSFTQGGAAVWAVDVDVADFNLAGGNYFFGLAIGTNDPGTAVGWFVASTTGSNGVGGPLGDDLSIYYQENFSVISWNYTESAVINDPSLSGFDPSYWINSVPTPGSAVVLGVAGLLGARRRR